jgi:hypothetical protein
LDLITGNQVDEVLEFDLPICVAGHGSSRVPDCICNIGSMENQAGCPHGGGSSSSSRL